MAASHRLGQTVDFLLPIKHDVAAARRFFEQAIDQRGVPENGSVNETTFSANQVFRITWVHLSEAQP